MPSGEAFSKSRVDTAGKRLRTWFTSGVPSQPGVLEDFEILSRWRAMHGPPMQATNMFLRSVLRRLEIDGQVKQRHKRHPQILRKLARQSTRLSQIEDIAGCRVIVPRLADVRRVEQCVASSRSRTQVVTTDDYVTGPP